MRLLLLLVLSIAFLSLLDACYPADDEIPIPQILSDYGVWPLEIPAGSIATMLEVRGSGFVPASVIQINGQAIPTQFPLQGTQIPLLIGLIPPSFLNRPKSIALRVLNPSGRASATVTIEVKPRKQPARLEIEMSTLSAGPKDQVDLTIRLTNEGTDSFYVPTRITPFVGGNMLNSYHFEVMRPNESVFTDATWLVADGFPKSTSEETLLQRGEIALVRPGESYPGKARVRIDEFSTRDKNGHRVLSQGQYTVRMRFDPRFPPGAEKYGTTFLTESVLSNAVVLTVN